LLFGVLAKGGIVRVSHNKDDDKLAFEFEARRPLQPSRKSLNCGMKATRAVYPARD